MCVECVIKLKHVYISLLINFNVWGDTYKLYIEILFNMFSTSNIKRLYVKLRRFQVQTMNDLYTNFNFQILLLLPFTTSMFGICRNFGSALV